MVQLGQHPERLAEQGGLVQAGLEKAGRTEKAIGGVMERQIAMEVGKLERLTTIVATIGNVAVYIGKDTCTDSGGSPCAAAC